MKQRHKIKIVLTSPTLLGVFERDTGLELWYRDSTKLCWVDIEVATPKELHDSLRLFNLHPAVRLAWLGKVDE
jgi:hypothetical protein